MKKESTIEDIADELGAVYEIIATILNNNTNDKEVAQAIFCNDNVKALLEYARGHTDRAFQFLEKLE